MGRVRHDGVFGGVAGGPTGQLEFLQVVATMPFALLVSGFSRRPFPGLAISNHVTFEVSGEVFRRWGEVFDFGAVALFGCGNWIGTVREAFGVVIGIVLGRNLLVVLGGYFGSYN